MKLTPGDQIAAMSPGEAQDLLDRFDRFNLGDDKALSGQDVQILIWLAQGARA